MYSVIDIGSNTIRIVFYRLEDGRLVKMMNKKHMIGLASYIYPDGYMSRDGITQAVETLREFQAIQEEFNIDETYVFATASVRNTKNTDEILSEIKNRCGIDVDVLSGEQEARCGYRGMMLENGSDDGVVIDIGGGSTEVVSFQDRRIMMGKSMNIGSLNLFNKYVSGILPKAGEIKEIEAEVKSQIKKIEVPKKKVRATAFAEGGSARTTRELLAAKYENITLNSIYESEYLTDFIDYYKKEKTACSRLILKTSPERVHTIIPGMLILKNLTDYLGCKKIVTIESGVREGYLWTQLKRKGVL